LSKAGSGLYTQQNQAGLPIYESLNDKYLDISASIKIFELNQMMQVSITNIYAQLEFPS
jgi:hypothetical protein